MRGLDPAGLAAPERPYLLLNMITTLDGKAVVEGRTHAMGNAADRAIFHELRARVDAVLVGAGTVRTERYGRLIRRGEVREARELAGLRPDPIACVVSGRLDLPADLPLLQDADSLVVVATSSDAELPPLPAQVEYLRQQPSLEAGAVLERLASGYGVRSLLCEGGPTLNRWLFEAGVVDELFLAVSPLVTGGDLLPTIVRGAELPEPVRLDPVWCLESEGLLFVRYRVRH